MLINALHDLYNTSDIRYYTLLLKSVYRQRLAIGSALCLLKMPDIAHAVISRAKISKILYYYPRFTQIYKNHARAYS